MASFFKCTLLSAVCGMLAAFASTIFLVLLEILTRFRSDQIGIVWFLPLAGYLIGWSFARLDARATADAPTRWTAPLVFIATLLTHLFGGSAGREGTAVQMGRGLAGAIAQWAGSALSNARRSGLLMAGMGSAFGTAVGAPWAGWIFGMERSYQGPASRTVMLSHAFDCGIASLTAYGVSVLLGTPHTVFIKPHALSNVALSPPMWQVLVAVSLLGIGSGIAVRAFNAATRCVERTQERWVSRTSLRPFWGGVVLIVIYQSSILAFGHSGNLLRYAGLSIELIQQTLSDAAQGVSVGLNPLRSALWKGLLTAITLGSGFKGGEFVPLLLIGASLGVSIAGALSGILPAPPLLLALCGFTAMFAGASNTPLACTILAAELFGPPIAPYAAAACWMSAYTAGIHKKPNP